MISDESFEIQDDYNEQTSPMISVHLLMDKPREIEGGCDGRKYLIKRIAVVGFEPTTHGL